MQHHLFALFVTTVWIAIWLVDGSIAGSTTSQSCYQEDANCNSEEDEDEFDVFAKLSKLHDDGSKFFMKNIFNKTESSQGKGSLFFKSDNEESTQKQGEGLVGILQSFTKMMLSPQSEHGAAGTNVANFLESARSLASLGDQKEKRGVAQIVDLFKISFDKAYETFERHFGNVKFDKLPISFLYFLEKEDEVKNPSWKRRQHRYYQSIDMKTVYELHNSLYLAQLSYVDSVGSVKEGLDDFEGSLELIYCKTEAFPGEPAHFIAIKKEGKSPGKSLFSWPQQEESVLEVVMVVRGTKEIGDLLTDALMDESNYRGGMTHSGVHQGAEYIFDKHIGLMDHLLEITGRQKLRLNLVGHSLGAGVAAIAAQMFNDRHYIEANAVGFGCPAVFSKELSESTRDFVTTVIVDSDIVPRMSGATVANVLLDMMSYDWTQRALGDTNHLLDHINATLNLPFDIPRETILNFLNSHFDKYDRPDFVKVPSERLPSFLIPPGTCIHIFRDGIGFSGKYTPCGFFDSVDVSRTMLADHLVNTGYHRALLTFARDQLNDLSFNFQHDILALPV